MRKYLWLFFRIGPYILFNYFWIFRYSRHPEKYTLEERNARINKFLSKVNKAFRVDFYISGVENLPSGEACFLTPNHLSNYDAILFSLILKRPFAFVAKKEILKFPFVGRLQKIYGGEFLDRKDLRQELRVMKNVRKSLAANEKDWIVFPEGKRNKNIKEINVDEFKHGTFKMPMEVKKDIIPVAIYGSHRVLSIKHHHKRYPVHVSILPAIKPSEYENLKSIDVCEKVEEMVRKEYIRIKDLNDKIVNNKD